MNVIYYHPVFKFDIDFEITEEKTGGTKKTKAFIANGYVADMIKFKAVAHFSKETEEFTELKNVQDVFDRDWLIKNSLDIIPNYDVGVLTLRGLHYQLVGRGMINHTRLYKRAVSSMIYARREGLVEYEVFSDHDRSMESETNYEETTVDQGVEDSKYYIKYWLNNYKKNRWENQDNYIEVLIEKKALIGVFQKPCEKEEVALGACKGYPSLTFLNDIAERYKEAESRGKNLVVIYFGDYDPSGEDIPRSIQENLENDFGVVVEMHRVALMEEQVIEMNLPPAPVKQGDSRSGNWDGLGQVELDAVPPDVLMGMTRDAIDGFFDWDLHKELIKIQEEEAIEYKKQLKEYVNNLKDDE